MRMHARLLATLLFVGRQQPTAQGNVDPKTTALQCSSWYGYVRVDGRSTQRHGAHTARAAGVQQRLRTNRWNGCHDLSELELVQDRRLACSVQPNCAAEYTHIHRDAAPRVRVCHVSAAIARDPRADQVEWHVCCVLLVRFSRPPHPLDQKC